MRGRSIGFGSGWDRTVSSFDTRASIALFLRCKPEDGRPAAATRLLRRAGSGTVYGGADPCPSAWRTRRAFDHRLRHRKGVRRDLASCGHHRRRPGITGRTPESDTQAADTAAESVTTAGNPAAEATTEATAAAEPEPPIEPAGCDHYSKSVDPQTWWNAHFNEAAQTVLDFFGGDGISLTGKRVADIGCGDGIIDLGVAVKARPAKIVGFDLLSIDLDLLSGWAAKYASVEPLPDNLFFATSEPLSLPAEDASFDYVISWSAFEHIADPVTILREVRRILVDDGVLFIQLWPFYHSAHGTHLVDWYPDGFAQFKHAHTEILRTVSEAGPPAMATEMLEVYRTLNGITADDLQAALRKAGFRIVKVALDAESVHLPEETAHLPLSTVAISGIKLLAVKAEPTDGPPPSKSALDQDRQPTSGLTRRAARASEPDRLRLTGRPSRSFRADGGRR